MTSATADRFDVGSRPLPGAYWMRTGRRRSPYRPRPDAGAGRYRHCFSYEDSDPTIKAAALELIGRARRKIFLASFRFIDPDLREALKKAADRLGGGVYVVTAINDRDMRAEIEDPYEDYEDEAAAAGGVSMEEEKKRYADLVTSGIWVRGLEDFHAKFLVVDDEIALVSSANLEWRALASTDAWTVTGENGVVVDDAGQASLLGRFFTRLWFEQCTWDAAPGRAYQNLRRRPSPSPCTVPEPAVGNASGLIWTSPDEPVILRTIHHIIDHAQHDLLLASFALAGLMDDPDLLHEPLRAAMARGVGVRLLVRSRSFAAARAEAAALAELGVEVYGDDKTHAKCAIADSRKGALFSANFDANHGLYSGVETGTRLDGEEALHDAVHFFEHCIAHAPQALEIDPTHQRASAHMASRTLQPWDGPEEIPVRCRTDHWNLLANAPGAVLFSKRTAGDDHVTLHAAGGKWRLIPAAERLELIERPGNDGGLIDDWLAPRRPGSAEDPYENHHRGIFPAVLTRRDS
ncbi:Phosphatidylserine/phosphatidylglycerophosphate/cardiolipin synthase [Actinomadura meyerae]|uniref:phospholipase D n=1 Tax=Actinomadura meyerae TaxID=240840 RepID=A0A239P5G9_9ACTN|nr:phospholipase D-like domain-containing protein [Actinomadura meyerae]SNT62365.1 Phosphatidylserine/phosphatidylglycerophosphate/cardiolipin synthase [Actinomadura meyerae]